MHGRTDDILMKAGPLPEVQVSAARDLADAAAHDGWFVTERIVDDPTIARVLAELSPAAESERGRGGVRNLLDDATAVVALARSPAVRGVAESVLGAGAFVVRALLFDKTPDANWKVIWHQDLTIAVAERRDMPGYSAWSEKAGVLHVQPPSDILERMLAVRVHLDDCGPDNGPVRVIGGTHRHGRLSPSAIDDLRAKHAESICVAARGAVLAFHPLLLHASSPATAPAHRRVLHFEFASAALAELPGGLAWRWAV